jgi:aryl-alcohol dehydrogenase (NADP+)
MKYKTLPGTDLNVSEICLGTMTWGQQNSEAEAHAQLDYAFERGVNFIDTAEMYPAPPNATTQGRTELFVGSWLARRKPANAIVASKVAGPRSPRVDPQRQDGPHAENIAEAVDTSLARLKVDCIDLYQIHWPQRNVPMFGATEFDPTQERSGPGIEEQVEGLAAMIKAGKIRYYGLSNETAWGVCEFRRVAKALNVPGPVTIQNSYSLVSRSVDNDLAETLFRENMSLLAYSPLGGGMLTGKYRGGAKPANSRYVLFDNMSLRFRKPIVYEAVDAYAALAERIGVSLVQLALGYVLSRWHLGAMIVGATSIAQLEETFTATEFPLDAAALEGIANLQIEYPNPAA